MKEHTDPAVQMQGISKRFGSVRANEKVDFTLEKQEIHALLGENGAGKTTLMRVLFGLYQPDEGEIWVNSQPVTIRSPKEAIALGIGMVSQHFALVPTLTVTENVIMGTTSGLPLNLERAHGDVEAAAQRYKIPVDPRARIGDLSVGQRQRVEILKALYRKVRVLIMDEPTAVLVPQEVDSLFESLRNLRADGLSVIFISHKLHEVMAITDNITVLRGGEVAGSVATADTNPQELARMMVGQLARSTPASPEEAEAGKTALVLENVSASDNSGLPAIRDVSLILREREILGLAGVSGNGQTELAEVLSGVRGITSGAVYVFGKNVSNAEPHTLMAAGVGRIPEDSRANVIGEMSVAQNMVIERIDDFSRNGRLDRKAVRSYARGLIDEFQIKTGVDDKIRTLSGGNLQKVVLARVLARHPKVLVVAQPTRGLDVGASEYVRTRLVEQRNQGAAVLLISEDLDEILQLSDRIAVIYEGEIMDIVDAEEADVEQLGLLMAGVTSP